MNAEKSPFSTHLRQAIRARAGESRTIDLEHVIDEISKAEELDERINLTSDELRQFLLESLIHQKKAEIDELSQRRAAAYNAELQGDLIVKQTNASALIENFKVVVEMGQSAMRSAMFLNGGTTVALLALIGSLIESERLAASVSVLIVSAGLSGAGAMLAALSFGMSRLSQEKAYEKHYLMIHDEPVDEAIDRSFKRYRSANFIFVWGSFGLFAACVLLGLSAFA